MVVTNFALSDIQSAVITDLNTDMTHVEVSTDTTPPTASDTTLGGTTTREATFSSSTDANSVTKNIFLDAADFNGNTIAKVGVFDAASSGNLYAADLVTSFAKTSTKEVFYEVKIVVTALNA